MSSCCPWSSAPPSASPSALLRRRCGGWHSARSRSPCSSESQETVLAEDRVALQRHYHQMREELLSSIDGLNDELMIEQLLDGWSVKDHLAHLALWDDLRAVEVA